MTILKINEWDIKFKMDTGTDVTIISVNTFKKLNKLGQLHLNTSPLNVTSPGGKLDIVGEF